MSQESSPWRHVAIITFVATVVLFTNLGGPRLWDRDEPRNVGCASEMLARGDWVVPYFNAEVRTHKPVLLYWLMMVSYQLLGQSEFSARACSALLSLGTCFCTYLIGRRLFSPRAGFWGAIILCTTFTFDIAARAATPDALLIFLATLALTIYARKAFPKEEPSKGTMPEGATQEQAPSLSDAMPNAVRIFESNFATISLYAVLGLGMLAKGPIGVVAPAAIIGMYLLIVRLPKQESHRTTNESSSLVQRLGRFAAILLRPWHPLHFLRTCWVMRPLTGLAVIATVSLPWYVWVGIRSEGVWINGFFVEHNLHRATGSMEGHGGSLLYYPIAILIGFFPWSSFAGPTLLETIARVRRGEGRSGAYVLLCCWVCVLVGLFSIAQTKLPSYIAPCYPALALLTGQFLVHLFKQTQVVGRRWLTASFSTPVIVGGVMVVAFALLANRYLPGDEWLACIGLIPVIGGAIGLWSLYHHQMGRAIGTFAVMSTGLCLAIFSFATQRLDQQQENHLLLAVIKEQADSQGNLPQVASFAGLEPSWVYYGGQAIPEIPYKEVEEAGEFLAQEGNLLITNRLHWEYLQEELDQPVQIVKEVRYFLHTPGFLEEEEKLILIQQGRGVTATATQVETQETSLR